MIDERAGYCEFYHIVARKPEFCPHAVPDSRMMLPSPVCNFPVNYLLGQENGNEIV